MSQATPEQDGVYAPGVRPETDNNEYNALSFMIQSFMNGLNVAMPVRVVSVNKYGGVTVPFNTVDVQPLVNMIDAKGRSIQHGVVHGLPIFRYGGDGGAFVAFPSVNDIGIAIFCDRDISGVKATRAAAPPNSRRRFSFSDGIYFGTILGPAPTATAIIDQTVLQVSNVPVNLFGGSVLQVEGIQVVQQQQPTVTPPTGGSTVDAQARTAINDIISRLQAHGLIA